MRPAWNPPTRYPGWPGICRWLARGAAAVLVMLLVATGRAGMAVGPEDFSVDTWRVEDGLPGNSVTSIVQGPDGYLWIGTFQGLVRFDGRRFRTLETGGEGLPSERVTQLHRDRAGAMWVAMEYGAVSRWVDGRLTTFTSADGWPGVPVTGFADDPAGVVHLMSRGSVHRYRDGRFSLVATNVAESAVATMLAFDGAGRAWMSRGETLGEWVAGGWRTRDDEGRGGYLRRLLARRDGSVWVVANGRIRVLRDGRWERNFGLFDWAISDLTGLLEDSAGRLWAATWHHGLFCLSPGGEVRQFRGPDGLPNHAVRALAEDREGNLWVGMNGGGLARIKRRIFRTFTPADVATTNAILALAEDAAGQLWLGTSGDGLAKFSGTGFSRPDLPGLPGRRVVWAVIPSREGGLWAGLHAGPGGVLRITDDEVRSHNLGRGDARDGVLSLLEGRDGRLWIGTETGVWRLRAGRMERMPEVPLVPVRAMVEDPGGNVWLGTTGGGLLRCSNGVVAQFTRADGLAGDSIRALRADPDGTLWVGTATGLSRWRDGRAVSFRREEGLPAGNVVTILADDSGCLWLGTSHGIVRVARSELEAVAAGRQQRIHGTTYLRTDGLRSVECLGGGTPGLRTSDGRLWFTMAEGLSVVDPAGLVTNPVPPEVVIEGVRIDGTSRGGGAVYRGVAAEVPPGSRQVEIEYTGLSFTAPERVRFQYRLGGYEAAWQEVGDRRVAYYNGLPPGHYRFEVRAANNDGVWSPAGAVLGLRVLPAFWQTAWFRGSVVAVAAGGLLLAYRRRIGALEARRRGQQEFTRQLLESQEAERRRIAGELHDGLGQDLVLVKNLALLGQRDSSAGRGEIERLGEISAATTRVLDDVRAISYALRPPQLDRLGLDRAIGAMVRRAGEASGIRFETRLELDRVLPGGIDIHVFRMAQEAVNNLVKHAGARNARVELWCDAAGLNLVIGDDGRGLPEGGVAEGRGLGLAGLRERVQMLGGRLAIDSAPGRGVRIGVIIPLPPAAGDAAK